MPGVTGVESPGHTANPPVLEQRFQLTAPDAILAAAVDHRAQRVAAVAADGTLLVADASGAHGRTCVAHPRGALAVRFSRDGSTVVTGGQDGSLRRWEAHNCAPRGEQSLGRGWVERVSQNPVDGVWAAAVGNEVVRLDEDLRPLDRMGPFPSTVADLCHVRGGGLLVACYGGLQLFSRPGAPPRSYTWKGSALVAAASPDGQWLATGCQDDAVHVWKRTSGKDMQMTGYASKPRALAWDVSSRLLATSGAEAITVWDFSGRGPQGSVPRELLGHGALVECLAFQTRGPLLASAGGDGAVMVWAVLQQQRMAAVTTAAPLTTLGWAPDDTFVMAGNTRGELTAWNVPT